MKKPSPPTRRKFLHQTGTLLGAGLLPLTFSSWASPAQKSWTVGEIMDMFTAQVPNAPFPQTVDTLKIGSRETVVTGIVTTMFPSIATIKKAVALKANLIIPHEPTFYSGQDDTDYLQDDPVFRGKYDLLAQHQLTVWRNHDYVHRMQDDGVRIGVVEELDWMTYYTPGSPVLHIPPTTLKEVIDHIKSRMKVPAMRFVGDLNQSVSKVLLLPGAVGGKTQITRIQEHRPDVLICGESNEWETPEYVKTAQELGMKLSMVEIGHSASEEGGSEFVKNWLETHIPGVPVYHIPSGNSLSVY